MFRWVAQWRLSRLARELANGDPDRRLKALERLENLSDADSLPVISQALFDENVDVRITAIEILVERSDALLEPAIDALLRTRVDGSVTKRIQKLLAHQRIAPRMEEFLKKILDTTANASESAQEALVVQLAALKNDTANTSLLHIARGVFTSRTARKAAARVISRHDIKR